MTRVLGVFGPKGAEIRTYGAAFVYQEPFRKDFSTGSRVINEVVLGPWISMIESKKIRILAVKPSLRDMVYMTELYEAGKVTPVIDKTYSLKEVPEAISYVGDGHAQGKVVITV